jgi:hypothetical protein
VGVQRHFINGANSDTPGRLHWQNAGFYQQNWIELTGLGKKQHRISILKGFSLFHPTWQERCKSTNTTGKG